MSELIFMEPYMKEVLWGGTRLRDEYACNTAGDHTGEAWLISATPPGCSAVKNGTYRGKTLLELWETHRELFGNLPGKDFPLLVKFIDAADHLSVQVHPNDEEALLLDHADRGKTECWYVADCSPDADIVIGHNASSKEDLKNLVENGAWDRLLRILPLHKGDFFFIPSGTVHAIRKGTFILEIQQNSDLTYRLYDYDRLQNGKKRPLHIDKSLQVITCPQNHVTSSHADDSTCQACGEGYLHRHLISCSYFSIDLWKKDESATVPTSLTLEQPYPFLLVNVISGNGSVNGIDLHAGDSFVAPAGCGTLMFRGKLEFVTSHV